MDRIRWALHRIRQSLFLVPSVIMVVAIGVAQLATYIDDRNLEDVPGLLWVSISGGRAIASAVAGATITVAAIVFSITALTSQIAATQYSPRAVAGFFENRFQKVVIGLVLGTFAFSLVVLGELSGVGDPDVATTPSLAVTAVLTLGVASVIAIVAYLDHSLNRMRIDSVIRRLADETVASIKEGRSSAEPEPLTENALPTSSRHRVEAEKAGWVTDVDGSRMASSLPSDTVVAIEVRVGEAVTPGDRLATMWCDEEAAAAARRAINRCIAVSRERSIERDPGYGIRQLVDIGLRALSPGINDPTTAIDVVQHLKLPVREILQVGSPRRTESGPDGQRVYLPETLTTADRIGATFSELRQAAREHPAVLAVIVETLADLAESLEGAGADPSIRALRAQARLAVAMASSSSLLPEDWEPVIEAGKRIDVSVD